MVQTVKSARQAGPGTHSHRRDCKGCNVSSPSALRQPAADCLSRCHGAILLLVIKARVSVSVGDMVAYDVAFRGQLFKCVIWMPLLPLTVRMRCI